MRFGSSIRAARTSQGLSQETLAERSSLHRTYISDVERGARNVTLYSIVRLASALEVPLSSLLPVELSEAGPTGAVRGVRP
jgi:transcriptional regulator with XRE-family HTH domain